MLCTLLNDNSMYSTSVSELYMFLLYSECNPYSEQTCRDVANSLGFTFGGAGEFYTKGCYGYSSGPWKDLVYYGTEGTGHQLNSSLSGRKFRPVGHNCPSIKNYTGANNLH